MIDMAAAFDEAARRRPDERVVTWMELAGTPTRLTVVGRQLAAHLAAPFGHLAGPAQRPALRIDVWDEAVTGVACPVSSDPAHFPRDVNGTLVRADGADPQRMWTAGAGAVTELDRREARMIGWRSDGSDLSIEERGRPFPVALQTWLESRAALTLHAAAVACRGRTALMVGDSGSGKSTAALVCAAAGFAFLGDDQVAVSWRDGQVVAHSLYASARIDGIVHRIWQGGPGTVHLPPNASGKLLALLSGQDLAVAPCAPVAAVIVVTVSRHEQSQLVRGNIADALHAMVPTTMLGTIADRPGVFRGCARTVLGRPVFHLRSGQDLDAVPRLVAHALGAP